MEGIAIAGLLLLVCLKLQRIISAVKGEEGPAS